MAEVDKLREAEKPLILHHWDTDGICSAAMIIRFLKSVPAKTMVPEIGMYSLSEDEFRQIKQGGHDSIILTDLAFPEKDYDRLASLDAEIWIFDHHVKDRREDLHQINPVARGSPPEDYPSATWVLHEYLETPLDLPTVLGAIGDKEEGIRQSPTYAGIQEYIESSGLGLKDLLRICTLIDSSYRVGDVSGIEHAVSFIIAHSHDPSALLTNEAWIRKDKRVSERISTEEVAAATPAGGVLVHHFSSDLDIVSAVSRRLTVMNGVRTSIVVQTGFFPEYDRVYVRTSDFDLNLRPILEMAKGRGHISGGKKEVVGTVVPVEDTEEFLNDTLRLLEVS